MTLAGGEGSRRREPVAPMLSRKCIACGALALVLSAAQREAATVSQARELLHSGRAAEAERLLQRAIVESPDSAELHGELGMLLYSAKRYEEAAEQLGRAAQLQPDSPQYAMALTEVLIGWRHFPVALDFLLAVRSKFDRLPEYHYNLGLAYYGIKNYSGAQQAFEQAAKIAPKLAPAYFFLGNSYAAMGNLEAAALQYRKALQLEPSRGAYCLSLGRVLNRLGPDHEEEALQWLKKSLALAPDDGPSKYYLALACERTGDLSRARMLLEEVVRQYPKDPAAHGALARIYYRLKDREQSDRESN